MGAIHETNVYHLIDPMTLNLLIRTTIFSDIKKSVLSIPHEDVFVVPKYGAKQVKGNEIVRCK